MDIERNNATHIARLNQRGGRTLSIVDLIRAGTLTAEMAALCWMRMARGASLMTGAGPGGAGKTTVMAAAMAFMPPGEALDTVGDRRAIDRALAGRLPEPTAMLAHEIGSGHWYGYIWGRDAADFFSLPACAIRCITCLHADDPEQARGILAAQGIPPEDFDRIGLQLYIRRDMRHGRILRRVAALHIVLGGRLRQLTGWTRQGDEHRLLIPREETAALLADDDRPATGLPPGPADAEAEWHTREAFIESLIAADTFAYEDVRAAILAHDAP